ncbi:MAG: carboxypeptidase-like regulatory domain-containing protein [Pedobacter sp.]|nr:MAG: carboxypeptidase-like regulatory domain-containing protein [Pedobacter sp.]
MSFRSILLFFFITLNIQHATAQDTFSISGIVKDESGATLPGASVLVSGYQKGSVAGSVGDFIISGLAPGSYNILVQIVGYFPASIAVTIKNKSASVDMVLKENKQMLNEVVIRPDRRRGEYLRIFREYFIGTSPNSNSCKIINPQVLDFYHDDNRRMLTASSREFLIIENKNLGYRIKYLLKHFEINDDKTRLSYYGFPTFEDLDKFKKDRFQKPRELAYRGSAQHFFKSLLSNKLEIEGFLLNKLLLGIKNEEKASDSLIQKKLRFFDQTDNENFVAHGADSLEYWLEMNRKPYYIDFLEKKPVLTDTLIKIGQDRFKTMHFDNALFVSYKFKKESFNYTKSRYRIERPYEFRNYQISVIKQLNGPIRFYGNGAIEDPQSLLFEGYWSYEKIGDAMPLDYLPIKKDLP